MAKATTKATVLTTLVIGRVEAAVGLFSTKADPGKLSKFDTAGPNGGVLKAQTVARALPAIEQTDQASDVPVHSSDPLADDPGPELDSGWQPLSLAPGVSAVAPEDVTPEGVAHIAEAEGRTDWAEQPAAMVEKVAMENAAVDVGLIEKVERDTPLPTVSYGTVDGAYGRELVEEGTGQVVPPDEVRRGVRLEDGRFVDCTEQLAEIEDVTLLDGITVVGFVDITAVPRARVKGAQYIGIGDEKAGGALRLLYEGIKRKRRGALVKLTKRKRQTLGVIGILGDTLVLYELVFSEDFREAPSRAKVIQRAAVTESQVGMMCDLIDAMAVGPSAVEEMRDDAIAKREALHVKALAGEVIPAVAPKPVEQADDVMAQLEASLAAVPS